LIDGRKVTAAGITGLHFESASPDLSLVACGEHFNMTGGTNIGTRATADADIRFFIIRCADGFLRAAGKQTDCTYPDHFLTNAHAGTAQNALAMIRIGNKPALGFHAHFFRHLLQNVGFGTSSQEQFHNQTTNIEYPVAFGIDHETFFHAVEAGGDNPGPVAFFYFHHAKSAWPERDTASCAQRVGIAMPAVRAASSSMVSFSADIFFPSIIKFTMMSSTSTSR